MLAKNEVAANVEIHDLVPSLNRVVFSRSPPGRTCIVDQDINVAHALDAFFSQCTDVSLFATVGSNPISVNTYYFELSDSLHQVISFARADDDFSSGFTQSMRHL